MPERPPIGVIGVGWVGLVTASCFAELGHHVWCRDIDARKIETLRGGEVPIFEPDLADLVARNSERLHFELDVAPLMEHARLLFVCVDTPPTYSGDADLSRVEAVIEELPSSPEHAIVMKSTVPVGTGANVRRRLGELGKGNLGYASNPEFLKEGSAVADFMNPDRVVVGSDTQSPWAADAVAQLYEELDGPVVRTDVASAEMIKLASNAFLATKISFINEIANVCEEVGADVKEVASGMGLDPRIGGSFLNAGVGFGGSCLVGDETVLVRRHRRTWLTTSGRPLHRSPKGRAGGCRSPGRLGGPVLARGCGGTGIPAIQCGHAQTFRRRDRRGAYEDGPARTNDARSSVCRSRASWRARSRRARVRSHAY